MNIIKKLRSRYKSYRQMIREREEENDFDRLFKAAADLAVEEIGREIGEQYDSMPIEPMSEEDKARHEISERCIHGFIDRYFPMKEEVYERAERLKRFAPFPFIKWYIEMDDREEVERRAEEIIKKELWEMKNQNGKSG